jgi:hypothetical protein
MNGLLLAARAQAPGSRNEAALLIVIYLIVAPLGSLFNSMRNVE